MTGADAGARLRGGTMKPKPKYTEYDEDVLRQGEPRGEPRFYGEFVVTEIVPSLHPNPIDDVQEHGAYGD